MTTHRPGRPSQGTGDTPTSTASTSTTRRTGGAAAGPAPWRARVGRDVRADPARPGRAPRGHRADLQGHGRTADIDRPIDVRLMADDIAALIDHLGLDKPDVIGYSLGGGVAFFIAVIPRARSAGSSWPRPTSGAMRSRPEMLAQQGQVNAAAAEFMKDTPMYQLYQRVAPRPEDFGRAARQDRRVDGEGLRLQRGAPRPQVPTMFVCADADMAPPSHYVEVFKLLDGGLRDGGWMGEGRPKGGHALAILPGLTHYDLGVSPRARGGGPRVPRRARPGVVS